MYPTVPFSFHLFVLLLNRVFIHFLLIPRCRRVNNSIPISQAAILDINCPTVGLQRHPFQQMAPWAIPLVAYTKSAINSLFSFYFVLHREVLTVKYKHCIKSSSIIYCSY